MKDISNLGGIILTTKSLSGEYYKSFFGIKYGKNNFNFPLKQISAVRYSRNRKIGWGILFAFLAIIGFISLSKSAIDGGNGEAGLLLLFSIFGGLAFKFLKGSHGVLISTAGGDSQLIILQESDGVVNSFVQKINNSIAENC